MDIKIFHSDHGTLRSPISQWGYTKYIVNLAKPQRYRCLHLCLLENLNWYLGLSQQRKKIYRIFIWRD